MDSGSRYETRGGQIKLLNRSAFSRLTPGKQNATVRCAGSGDFQNITNA